MTDLERGGVYNMNGKETRIRTHKEAKAYIASLRDGSPNRKEEAKRALIKTGVLDRNGERKETIVSWE